jgi:hypothetical protein
MDFPMFMKQKGSLQPSQNPLIEFCSEPREFSSYTHSFSKMDFNIFHSYISKSPKLSPVVLLFFTSHSPLVCYIASSTGQMN